MLQYILHTSPTCIYTVALKWLVGLMDLDAWPIADGYALSGSNPVFLEGYIKYKCTYTR